jgi:hypothetical protein
MINTPCPCSGSNSAKVPTLNYMEVYTDIASQGNSIRTAPNSPSIARNTGNITKHAKITTTHTLTCTSTKQQTKTYVTPQGTKLNVPERLATVMHCNRLTAEKKKNWKSNVDQQIRKFRRRNRYGISLFGCKAWLKRSRLWYKT